MLQSGAYTPDQQSIVDAILSDDVESLKRYGWKDLQFTIHTVDGVAQWPAHQAAAYGTRCDTYMRALRKAENNRIIQEYWDKHANT